MKYAGISFVAAKKLILNVSKIRLRLIFPRASDLPRLFQKAYGKLYTTCGYWESSTYQKRHGCRWFHAAACLRSKHVGKKCTGRTFFTVPAGVFCALLASTPSISKGLRQMVFQDGQGCPWFRAATSLPANLQPKNVQGCIFLGEDVRGSTQKRRFVLCTNLVVRTPKDGRGISQK